MVQVQQIPVNRNTKIKLLKETFVGVSKTKTNDNKYFFTRYLYDGFDIIVYDDEYGLGFVRVDFYDSKNDRLLTHIKSTKKDLENQRVDKVFAYAKKWKVK